MTMARTRALTLTLSLVIAGCQPAQAADRLLWLTHQLDAGPQLRQALQQHYQQPDVLQLLLSSPEVQLR